MQIKLHEGEKRSSFLFFVVEHYHIILYNKKYYPESERVTLTSQRHYQHVANASIHLNKGTFNKYVRMKIELFDPPPPLYAK